MFHINILLFVVNFMFLFDDVLSLNNANFGDYVERIYHIEQEIKDTTDTVKSASYLDLQLEIDNEDIHQSEIIYVTKSSNVTLHCPFKSVNATIQWSGPPNLTLYSDNSQVISSLKDVGTIRGSKNGEYHLFIYGFKDSNEGSYQCSTLSGGKPVEHPFNVMLRIRKPVLSMVISPPELVIEGTDVTFECNATSRPAPNLLTLTGPDGNILKFNKITENRMMLRWTMSDIRSNEMGNYTCTADNNVANETVSSWLNILYPPKVTINGRNFSETESVRSLTCIAEGNPDSYKYKKWKHSYNGQHIRYLAGFKNGTLVLPFTNNTEHRYKDSGSYTCFVGNNIPKSESYQTKDIFIQATGRPVFLQRNLKTYYGKYGDPINIQFYIYSIPDDTSVEIVQDNRNVSFEYGTEQQNVSDTFHNQHVQLLMDVVTFRIPKIDLDEYFKSYTIQAKNKNGDSSFTFQLKANTCYCPDVPDIKGVLAGTKSVKIIWRGGYNGGSTQTFTIEYKPEFQEKWFARINITPTYETSNTAVISNLQPNELYNVRMYAVNSMNRSQFTTVFNVTTVDDSSSNMFSYLPVYITVGLGLFITAIASVGYLWYKSDNLKSRHEHSENRNSGQQEGNAAFNNIYDINENRQPTAPGAASSTVMFSNFNRDEVLRTNCLPCRPSTSHIKPLDQQPVKQKPSELNYIEIELDPIPQDRKFYIHGNDNRTEYSEIEFGVVGDPLLFSESETDDDNDQLDCVSINT